MANDLKTCPKLIYRFCMDWSKREFKLFDDFDEAVAFAREYMEADGKNLFIGEQQPGNGVFMWEDRSVFPAKITRKTIGLVKTEEYKEWERKQKIKEASERWDRIRAMYGKGPFANQA